MGLPVRCQICSPLFGDRAVTRPRTVPSIAVLGAVMIDVRQPVGAEVGNRQHPVTEQPVRQLGIPGANRLAGAARPDGGAAVLVDALRLEAGSGGEVGAAVAVHVERLAEAEAELAVGQIAADATRQTPALPGHGAGGRRGSSAPVDRRRGGAAEQCREPAARVRAVTSERRRGTRVPATPRDLSSSSRPRPGRGSSRPVTGGNRGRRCRC